MRRININIKDRHQLDKPSKPVFIKIKPAHGLSKEFLEHYSKVLSIPAFTLEMVRQREESDILSKELAKLVGLEEAETYYNLISKEAQEQIRFSYFEYVSLLLNRQIKLIKEATK